jgi:hypothetical protein
MGVRERDTPKRRFPARAVEDIANASDEDLLEASKNRK